MYKMSCVKHRNFCICHDQSPLSTLSADTLYGMESVFLKMRKVMSS